MYSSFILSYNEGLNNIYYSKQIPQLSKVHHNHLQKSIKPNVKVGVNTKVSSQMLSSRFICHRSTSETLKNLARSLPQSNGQGLML